MVAYPGAESGAGRLRALNQPRPVRLEAKEDGTPAAVYFSKHRRAVTEVIETWRIDDEWWRERPISRLYYRLLLKDGRTVDVFRDRLSEQWSRQAY